EVERPAVRAEAERRLADAAHPAGGFVMYQQVRYTLGIRPPAPTDCLRVAQRARYGFQRGGAGPDGNVILFDQHV
ncbi:MAG: hypothetical protein WCF36_08270, partial [Candidatus Nanopelagicales bacterium]